MRLVFVVPAFQAERSIQQVVTELVRESSNVPGSANPSVLVVDDGSTDRTAALAEQAGAQVVVHGVNRGKGAALLTGFEKAHELGFTAAVTVDADGQHPTSEALVLARHPAPENALVLGVRDLLRDGAPRASRFSNGFSNVWMSWFSRRRLSDTQCGLRRYPVAETLALGLNGTGYELEAEVILRAVRERWPVVEVPVRVFYPPQHERVSHFDAVRDPARIVSRILRTVATSRWRSEHRP